MHRSYQSVLPTHNKLLQQRWDQTYYDEHQRKVKTSAPIVDTLPPKTYMHLHLKLKKLQLEEERLATIERDNRILLEKMTYIMHTKGRVDNRNNYEYKSLNREKRMRELLRVTKENQEILQRITARKPEYDHKTWQKDWKQKQKFMDNISRYPKDWWVKQGSKGAGREAESRQSTRSVQSNASKASKKKKQEPKEETVLEKEEESQQEEEQTEQEKERSDEEQTTE